MTAEPGAQPGKQPAAQPGAARGAAVRRVRDRAAALRTRAAAGPWPDRAARYGPLAVICLALVAEFVLGVVITHDGWFGVDAFYYLAERNPFGDSDVSLLTPYAGHWQTLTILLYSILFEVFGFNYLPFALVALAWHLAIVALLYSICVRLGVHRWLACAGGLFVVFFGAGSQAFLSDAPMALTAGLCFGLIALRLAVHPDSSLLATRAASVVLVLGLMFSATGVVALVLVGFTVHATRGLRVAIRLVGPAVLVFALWALFFWRGQDRVHLSLDELTTIPEFVLTGLTAPLGNLFGLQSLGPVLLVCAVAAPFLARSVAPGLRAWAFAGLLAAGLQATLTALASLTFGTGAAIVSRYQYVLLVLLLPALLVAVHVVAAAARPLLERGQRQVAVLFACCLVALSVASGLAAQQRENNLEDVLADHFRSWTGGVVLATESGQRVLTGSSPDVLSDARDLAAAAAPQWREKLPEEILGDQNRVDAEALFYVGVGIKPFDEVPEPDPVLGDLVLSSDDFDQRLVNGLGCRDYTATTIDPELDLASPAGGQIAVSSASGTVGITVERGQETSPERQWTLLPGQLNYIATTARDALLTLHFDLGGQYTICTGGAQPDAS